MAAFKVKNLWTVFLTAFFAVLATLGLTAPAAAADAAVQQPAEQPVKGDRSPTAEARGGGEEAPAVRAARALPESARPVNTSRPPTIEQRIRAEAHGSSPSVRRLPVDTRTDADVARDNEVAADAALAAAA
ncbi:DUF6344 domain-containing protein [Streptomyces sp. IB2014 016-6]|uniref:DUF6344 domain-containing protein n=1 Tax=Streptomyces sp. IB2014 016-6 TaxID=2517818 RepID=UPI0011CBC874|nr:DUF6344 domain-containing protein [Streptomyces sp. IB2014 016-6]TXL91642.1 hypothetical protein EW053_04790 [Streptomyces sp. IB2014 016-6]